MTAGSCDFHAWRTHLDFLLSFGMKFSLENRAQSVFTLVILFARALELVFLLENGSNLLRFRGCQMETVRLLNRSSMNDSYCILPVSYELCMVVATSLVTNSLVCRVARLPVSSSNVRYLVCKQLPALTSSTITILCRNLLKNTQFRQSKEKPSLYVGFQVMSAFLEMRRLILLQKMGFLSLLLH